MREKGSPTLQGLAGPIRLDRTPQGTARITADDLDDAITGLGYWHGKDRGLQLRLVRLFGQGRCCELLRDEPELFELDRFFRRLNFGRDAESQTQSLAPRTRRWSDAYCRGINQAFDEIGIPWELRWLARGYKEEPWEFSDIYLTAKVIGYVALAISQNEVERWIVECLQGGIDPDLLEELFPGQLAGLDLELIRGVRLIDRIVPESLWRVSSLPAAMASNNWVLAGTKTESGSPFVCNDPHLQVNRVPPFWYEAVLRWGGETKPRYAMGATIPGIPGIVVGRTPDLAWSVTYAFMDCVDSWVEECRDGCFKRSDSWVPFDTRRETILRSGGEPVQETFYENLHGTLEGDPHQAGHYLTTRWACGEETGGSSLEAIMEILEAQNVDQGQASLSKLCNSSWNWLLADRQGDIGYQMAGKMPQRPPGFSGLVPLRGADPAHDWQGFVPVEDLPRAKNPPEGFLATANDDLNALGRAKPINLCVANYRAERIRDILAQPRTFSIEDMKALQFDLYSIQAERFMTLLKPILERGTTSENRDALLSWNLNYDDDSTGAYLFECFYRNLLFEVFGGPISANEGRNQLGEHVLTHLLDETTIFTAYYGAFDRVLLSERSGWFRDRTRDQIFQSVLERTLDTTSPQPYGKARRLRFEHLMLGSKLPLFLGIDLGPVSIKGGRATVHQGQLMRSRGRLMACGPSYRFVTDLGTDELHSTLPGGPSDRRFSPWYGNGLKEWFRGDYQILRDK